MARKTGYKMSDETKAKMAAKRQEKKEAGKRLLASFAGIEDLSKEELAQVISALQEVKKTKMSKTGRISKETKERVSAIAKTANMADTITFKSEEGRELSAVLYDRTKTGRLKLRAENGFTKTIVPYCITKINGRDVLPPSEQIAA